MNSMKIIELALESKNLVVTENYVCIKKTELDKIYSIDELKKQYSTKKAIITSDTINF